MGETQGVSRNEADAMFKEMDQSGSGVITVAKFDHYAAMHTLDMVKQIFKSIDTSSDKQILKQEFKTYFMENGLNQAQAHKLWDSMDLNRNGKISFIEFRDWGLQVLETHSLEEVAAGLGLS